MRYCQRLLGDTTAAEDIAQEALLAGVRQSGAGRDAEAQRMYLYGIARRLCHNRMRQRQREESGLSDYQTEIFLAERASSEPDPLDALIQSEREALIERALANLKEPVRAMLISRYVNDAPLSELAAQMGVTENAAAVRLHRSRDALKKLLSTKLRDEAATHGLLDEPTVQGWRETPIICCRCGKERLQGRFEIAGNGGESPHFALRCPTCHGDLIGMTSNVASLEPERVLGGVKGFRAGLNRVNRWWQEYLANGLRRGKIPCVRCGATAQARIGDNGFGVVCDSCGGPTFFIRPLGLMYHSDEFQDFWRRHPRARSREEREIICEGRPAVLAAFADAATSARLEMIFDRQTMQKMR